MELLSSGYLKAITLVSFAYGLFYTVQELEKGEVSKEGVEEPYKLDEVVEATLKAYRDSLKIRLLEFMQQDKHKGYSKKIDTNIKKLFNFLEMYVAREVINLDLLALYVLNEVINNKKTSTSIKELVDETELSYMLELIESGETKLINKIKARKKHKIIAKKIVGEFI
jgi:hypothetical protein